MTLRDGLLHALQNYCQAKQEKFAKHPIRKIICDEIPDILRNSIDDSERYKISSIGQASWADVAWIATLDSLITTTNQSGFYVVYLMRSDCKGIYLALGQGVTDVHLEFKIKADLVLRERASYYRSILNLTDSRLNLEKINLKPQTPLSSSYGPGLIYSIYYETISMPSEDALISDYKFMINAYKKLYDRNISIVATNIIDEEEEFYEEDLTKIRTHRSVERDSKISVKVKEIQGYKCKGCEEDFVQKYGEIGKACIEAHHLIPVSVVKGQKLTRDLKNDYAVLCANCHRLIHRLPNTNDISRLKALLSIIN